MASTYTTNLGIEKIGTGEQSGTWGDTTNTNFDILDEAINGIISVTLSSAGSSGSPTALPITDGSSSNGRNKFIEFTDGGDLGGTAYVQLTPNDAEKIVHIRNSLSGSRSVIVFQGTYNASNDFEIANGADVLLKFNGGGSGATVTDVNVDLTVTGVTATTANATTVDTTNLEVTNIKAKDGTSAGSIADSTGVVTLASSVLTTTDINGGTIDGAVIGGASAAAITATTITGTTITASTAVVPDASDGATLGSTSLEWSDLYLADGAVVFFGDDQDITLTHVADTGLTLKHANTGDDKFPTFLLATGDTDIAADDKLGVINFQAPDEGAGTDAILVAAGIEAISEGDFSASSNATSLVFKTGASEAAAEKFRVTSAGNVGIGTNTPADLLHIKSTSADAEITLESTNSGGDARIRLIGNSSGSSTVQFQDEGDSNIGFISYLHSDNAMTFRTNDSEKMRINSSGSVGIGTSSPTGILHLKSDDNGVVFQSSSSSNSRAQIFFQNNGGTTTGKIAVDPDGGNANVMAFSTGSSERFRIDSSGDVGIGTTNPTSKLHVSGSSGAGSRVHIQSTGAGLSSFDGSGPGLLMTATGMNTTSKFTPAIQFGTTDTSFTTTNPKVGAAINGVASQSYSADDKGGMELAFYTTPNDPGTGQTTTERMRIDDEGNVGIGATSLSNKLTVNGNQVMLASGEMKFADAGNSLVSVIKNGGSSGNSQMQFLVGSTPAEKMRLDGSGNFLVGTTASSKQSGAGFKLLPDGGGTNNQPRLQIVGDGAAGDLAYALYDTGDSALKFYVRYDGVIFATSTSISAISDQSLKDNIRDLDKGLEAINALKPRRFDWKDGSGKDIMGFVAQEVEDSFDELVHDYEYRDEETKLALKMGDMIPSMVKAIQELSAQVNELKAEIAALKGA